MNGLGGDTFEVTRVEISPLLRTWMKCPEKLFVFTLLGTFVSRMDYESFLGPLRLILLLLLIIN